MPNALSCDFDDARANHLRDGIGMSTEAKIAFFEEMVALAHAVGATDRLRAADAALKLDASRAIVPGAKLTD